MAVQEKKLLVVFGTLLLLAGPTATCWTAELCDDFVGSSDPFDCDPVCWSQAPCCPGLFTLREEGLEVFPVNAPGLAILGTSDSFSGDVTVRLVAEILGDDARSLVALLHFDLFTLRGYFGGIRREQFGPWKVAVAKYDGQFVWRQESDWVFDFDPTQGWFELEFLVRGDWLEVRTWPNTADRPERAQLVVFDSHFRAGSAGFGYNRWTGENRAVFQEVCIVQDDGSPRLPPMLRGDCNDDASVDISDAICILDWLFLGRDAPLCVAATNVNGDSGADISDAVYVLTHLFLGGHPPVSPFPECGSDALPVDETLGCATPPGCR